MPNGIKEEGFVDDSNGWPSIGFLPFDFTVDKVAIKKPIRSVTGQKKSVVLTHEGSRQKYQDDHISVISRKNSTF